MKLTGNLLIGADEVHGGAGEFYAVNPRTGETLEPGYGLGESADVAAAARLALAAFDDYRDTDTTARAGFLERIAAELDALGEALVERVMNETGIAEARVRGELARTTKQLRLFADVLREGSYRGVRTDPGGVDLRQRRVPLGPVAVFAASNFPLAFSVAGGDTAAALAAGCPVIVKAHPAHPGVSELVGRAVRSAVTACDLPEGTFSLLHGDGPTFGTALVQDPNVRAVGFTGSRRAGLALTAAAQARAVPIPVYAEMSAINPVFVLPGALAARAQQLGTDYIASVTTGLGQLCTCPGLLGVIDGPGYPQFRAAAIEAVTATTTEPMLTAGTSETYASGLERLRGMPGVNELARGATDAAIAAPGRAHLFETDVPTLIANPALQDEVFGPASVIVRANKATELRELTTRLPGQLTATVHAEPTEYDMVAPLLAALEPLAGRIVFNGWPTGVEVGHAVVHGGPFPATSAPATTSVGTRAIERFLRPISYQNLPGELLAPELRDGNPLRVPRRVDGQLELP